MARWPRVVLLASVIAAGAAPGFAESPVRLCLMPLDAPFEQDDPRSAMVEAKISRRFEEGLFEVVRSQEIKPLTEAVEDRWGQIYDPALGNAIPDALARHQRELGRVLREKIGCHATIQVSVRVVLAPYAGGSARWDGVVMTISTSARQWLLVEKRGWVSALSLWVELFDLDGESLSFRSAGIEPLIHLSLKRSIDRLPEDRWLRDENSVDRAIDSALGPMALDLRERGFPTASKPDWPFEWPVSR